MSRFDYDTIFYRVFCATILGIAFTFTVILTNVFIDIDGLLSKKDDSVPQSVSNSIEDRYKTENIKNEVDYNDEPNYMDEADSYRVKRSIDAENFMFQVKNPNIKKILTNKLATLLEEMDEEETSKRAVAKAAEKEDNGKETRRKEELDDAGSDNMLHLAMHNILLQGIIGHMDLNDVYKKVHLLIKNVYAGNTSERQDKLDKTENAKEFDVENTKTSNTEEHKFFEELLKCKTLQNQLTEGIKNESRKSTTKHKEPKLFIKTIIEINENRKFNKENESQNKDVIGLIKLIYNGKSVRFEKMDDEEINTDNEKPQYEKQSLSKTIRKHKIDDGSAISTVKDIDETLLSNPVFSKIIQTYLKQHSLQNDADCKKTKANRLKRQIKIHYVDRDSSAPKPKPTQDKIKRDDEELYIEIETHFDGKGSKGERKKKIVRNLIDKIQKAIREDGDNTRDKKKTYKHIKVKKRNQDPIKPKHDYFLNDVVPSLLNIDHRDVDPIGKTLPPIENILDYQGDSWKRIQSGPAFLTASKSVNSAEMGELVIHYASMLKDDIPERIQKPINIDHAKSDDMKNATFYLKDIDGSGFSVGFNQYVDEPPDTDSLKLFNGLENLIQEYHKNYDTEDINNIDKNDNFVDTEQQYMKRQQESIKNGHDITRRSVKSDKNSKTFNSLLKRMIFPLNLYKNAKGNTKSVNYMRHRDYTSKRGNYHIYPGNINIISKPINIKDMSIVFNNNYYSDLEPHKFKIDRLLQRKKRSLTVKKISNLKSKIKLNKFINTKTLTNKRLFLKSKRNKREVNKIRIIARDRLSQPDKKSNENVFLVSPENSYYISRKSAVKETDTPDTVVDKSEIQNSDLLPLSDFLDLNYPNPPVSAIEDGHNLQQAALMSKYPHIFYEEVPKSKEYSTEENVPMKPYRIQARSRIHPQAESNARTAPVLSNVRVPGVEDIVNAILPQTKSNYRVTIKISPKNVSNDLHSGFKEIHTSVNKSYDKNGLRYFSSLNVSQISKIENLNESADIKNSSDTSSKFMPVLVVNEVKEKEKQIKTLFELHKKRIDAQLDNLQRERMFLENLLNTKNDFDKSILGLDVKNYNYKHHNYVAPLDYTSKPTITTVRTTMTTATTKRPVTTSYTFKTTTKPTVRDKEKEFLITTIKHNDNTTKEILSKLDGNTNLLRIFLNKLSNYLESNKPTTEIAKLASTDSLDWKSYAPNNQLFRKLSEFRNSTHTIPFIYTFSQPDEASPSLNAYPRHDMINTNDLDDHPPMKPVNAIIRQNQSRFFIDELENINPDVSATIKINTTHA